MLGTLPTQIDIHGTKYKIRTDYRNILRIFECFADPEMTDSEKMYVCLKRLFVDFRRLPRTDYQAAYDQACQFIACGRIAEKDTPRTFSWIKDEPLIFPAINKVAGMEVRSVPYMHWWTFMGYFESIDAEGLFGTVLYIRQKKARHKKLEKHEQEFWRNNQALMALDAESAKPKSAQEKLEDMFNELASEGGE